MRKRKRLTQGIVGFGLIVSVVSLLLGYALHAAAEPAGEYSPAQNNFPVEIAAPDQYECADVNCDMIADMFDVLVLIEYHFSRSSAEPCPEHGGGDVNADGCYNFLDVVCLIVWIFKMVDCVGDCTMPGTPPPCGPCPDADEPDILYLTPAAGFPGDQVTVNVHAWTDLVLIDPYVEIPLKFDDRLNFVSGQYRDGTPFDALSDSTVILWGGGPFDYKFLILGGMAPHPITLLMASMTFQIDPVAPPGEAYIDSTFIGPAHIIAFYDFNDPHDGCSTPSSFDQGVVTIYADADGDRVWDEVDNCPFDYNPNQADNDLDGIGDVCDTCDCGPLWVWGDVSGEGEINPVDAVLMVNYVYKNFDQRVQPPNCPFESGDVTCDGAVNPVDAVHYVNYVYKNITPWPCTNPCSEP